MSEKYQLILHGEDGDETVETFDTPEARDRATFNAIYHGIDFDPNAPDLEVLREDGIIYFEGDPPLEWRTVEA